ncbi:MAG TPA: lipoate--protein ligase [Bacteroidales bacterium]|nr:lipoate--protein ligase [Bacteroidales bacterium]HPT20501.1 lipoate--protein ligase [Bacteroidales bacterium]
MLCLVPESDDPFFNLAIEEILLKDSDEEFIILGINNQSVIIGKNQSAHREVDTGFLYKNGIPVIRRISGGGTVFHDNGNLNFTFIRRCEEGKQIDFLKHTQPVMRFLSSLGVEAKFEGKNDLKVGGLKVSGNAEYVHHNRVLHHGTLLFSSSLDILRKCIRKDKSCYSTKAVESNPSPVMNLHTRLEDSFTDIYEFRSAMMDYFLGNIKGTVPYNLTHKETENAESLAVAKYRSWDWNYAYGPEYTFKKGFYIHGEYFPCHLHVKDGVIAECDFGGARQFVTVTKKLIGCRHMYQDILEILEEEKVPISREEVFNFF